MDGVSYYSSPAGLLEIRGDETSITHISFVEKQNLAEQITPVLAQCKNELQDYFQGNLKNFSVRLNPSGTDFQHKVWQELLQIPFGKTISYTELALRLGDLKSIRAAGLANGKNPIAILIPCHRVIGKDGDLVGYAGGLDKKKYLLQHEGVLQEQLEMF